MSANFYDFKCVVMTHAEVGTPHLDNLKKFNHGLNTEVWVSPKGRAKFPNYDLNLRDWARANDLNTGRVLFIEYDTKVTGDLRPFFTHKNIDLEGSFLLTNIIKDKHYCFYPVVRELPKEMHDTACIMAPFGAMMFSHPLLNYLADFKFDNIYDLDLRDELRTPSLASYGGFRCSSNHLLTHIKCRSSQLPSTPSTFIHPVKWPTATYR